MSSDYTELQSGDDQQQARDLSLRHTRPPTQVPGYDLARFLGSGAYGEVWIGLDRNTGRQVAVKFYLHRGGVDWSLLSREVEKLSLLSADRYVVQLLEVGWQADPPYYVMEYIENGSLEKYVRREEPRSIDQIVELFREIATGLNHAHAKGILHCDLKPANVLLDQDDRPRLADFGQSRLTDEQAPSLGTLFYMAPEQADLQAIPDARWDVYALGAILYCMLAGQPPYHSEELLKQIEAASDLPARLRCYRHWITTKKPPDVHRRSPGVDRALAGIVDRCLQPRPSKRFPNVQSVLDALRARDQARARRPLLLLGVLGPLILLALMVWHGSRSYEKALEATKVTVIDKVWMSNRFAAKFVAASVAAEIDRYYRAIELAAADPQLEQFLTTAVDQLDADLATLADPRLDADRKAELKQAFLVAPVREALQQRVNTLYNQIVAPLEKRYPPNAPPQAVSLYVCGPRGTHLAGAFPNGSTATIGDNFAYRSYCHGGLRDFQDKNARPMPEQHVRATSISSPLDSVLNRRWKIAVSTPLYRHDDPRQLLAVMVLSVEVGEIVGDRLVPSGFAPETAVPAPADAPQQLTHFAVLVDRRDNGFQGMVLDHPMLRQRDTGDAQTAINYSEMRVSLDERDGRERAFRDPFGDAPGGAAYRRDWIAASAPVKIQRARAGGATAEEDTGLTVFVQEDRNNATTPVREMGQQLADIGVRALMQFLVVVALLWCLVFYAQGGLRWWRHKPFSLGTSLATPTPAHSRSTAAEKTPRDRA